MSLLSVLTAFLRAAAALFEYKAKTAIWDRYDEESDRLKELEVQLDAAHRAADSTAVKRLHHEIKRTKTRVQYLSTANQPVQTVDGIYTPQTDELWFSEKMYRELEELYLKQ